MFVCSLAKNIRTSLGQSQKIEIDKALTLEHYIPNKVFVSPVGHHISCQGIWRLRNAYHLPRDRGLNNLRKTGDHWKKRESPPMAVLGEKYPIRWSHV